MTSEQKVEAARWRLIYFLQERPEFYEYHRLMEELMYARKEQRESCACDPRVAT